MGGGGGCKTKNLLLGEYGYFLELHNVYIPNSAFPIDLLVSNLYMYVLKSLDKQVALLKKMPDQIQPL